MNLQVIDYQYSLTHNVLGYKFNNGAIAIFGMGPLPGTSVISFRCLCSNGFADRNQYESAKKISNNYSVSLGYKSNFDHYMTMVNNEEQNKKA
jgi:hypothetical protein